MIDIYRMMQLAGILTEGVQLDEAREDFIATQQGEKILDAFKKDNSTKPVGLNGDSALDIIKYISEKTNAKGAIVTVIKWYINGEFKISEVDKIKHLLDLFEQTKKFLEIKDINKYTVALLTQSVEEKTGTGADVSSHASALATFMSKIKTGYHILIDSPHFKVVIPTNKEDAKTFAPPYTEWCTAKKDDEHNHWDDYSNENLYIIYAGGKLFELHYGRGEFKNAEDDNVSQSDIDWLCKFPEYDVFLNKLISKYYLKKPDSETGLAHVSR